MSKDKETVKAPQEQEKKEKKSHKGAAAGGVGIALIAALAAVFANFGLPFGLGGGAGTNSGTGSGDTSSALVQESQEPQESQAEQTTAAAEQTTDTAETTAGGEVLKTVGVTVSENNYLYQNNPITLSELEAELKKLDPDVKVVLTDNRASKNAYDELKAKLDEAGIAYIEE